MHANHPPRAVRRTREPYSVPSSRPSVPAAGECRWPGLTTAQSLAVASQFGVTLAVAVGMGIFAGEWLDRLLHSGIVLTLIGALVGLLAGTTGTIALYRATLRKGALEWREEQQTAAPRAATTQRRNL